MRRRRKCPRHDVRLTKSDEVAEKIITDLVFTKNGCRKTFVKYVGAKGYCKTCDCHYLPPAIFKICKNALGYGFQAWVTYQRVALRQPYEAITQMMEDMFEERITDIDGGQLREDRCQSLYSRRIHPATANVEKPIHPRR